MSSRYDRCPGYWQGCFDCPDYLGPEHLFFCREYNRHSFGGDIAEVVIESQQKSGKSEYWWAERADRRSKPHDL